MLGYGSWGFGNCLKLEVLNGVGGGACCQCCGGIKLGCSVLPFSRLCNVCKKKDLRLLPPVSVKPVQNWDQA